MRSSAGLLTSSQVLEPDRSTRTNISSTTKNGCWKARHEGDSYGGLCTSRHTYAPLDRRRYHICEVSSLLALCAKDALLIYSSFSLYPSLPSLVLISECILLSIACCHQASGAAPATMKRQDRRVTCFHRSQKKEREKRERFVLGRFWGFWGVRIRGGVE